MPATEQLPDYDPALKAYHTAFEPELEAAIRRYDLAPDAQVLDSPCGDGFYTNLFARRMQGGTLVAADLSPAYLDRARRALRDDSPELEVRFVKADAYKLPFEDDTCDLVWCAQSMISLDDPRRAIREMARVLKPGGRLAVLETDEYHHVLLPWPVSLELAIQKAVRAVCKQRFGSGEKFAQSRKLRAEFLEAGLTPLGKRTIVADRVAPFKPADRAFLTHHFEHLRKFVQPELKTSELDELNKFTSADDPESFLNRADAELTCLASVCHATK
jgi:ubiquinone/menaquinone biosynthesis C-methylase UbiE